MKILKYYGFFPRFVILNLITLSHLSDTGQADRTVLLDRQAELFCDIPYYEICMKVCVV